MKTSKKDKKIEKIKKIKKIKKIENIEKVEKDEKDEKDEKIEKEEKDEKREKEESILCNNFLKKILIAKKSIQINYLFWYGIIFMIFYFAIFNRDKNHSFMGNIIINTLTFIFAMVFGYLSHYWCHKNDFSGFFTDFKSSDTYIGKFIRLFPDFITNYLIKHIYTFYNFHDIFHHNSDINKNWNYQLLEFINNLYFQGIFYIFLFKYFNFGFSINNFTYRFNYMILMFWALCYGTIHIINYTIIGSSCHEEHHKYKKTNYGIDLMDILYETKYDINNFENMNHSFINIVLITIILSLFKNSNSEISIIRFVKWFL